VSGEPIVAWPEAWLLPEKGYPTPNRTQLRWSPSTPYVVTIVFSSERGDVEWLIGRELLNEGLERRAGEGDVCVEPDSDDTWAGEWVRIGLCSPTGTATFALDFEDVEAFLLDTYERVPADREWAFVEDFDFTQLLRTA
jgi:hypothetical protein